MSPSRLAIRLRTASSELLGLPWNLPLLEWDATEVPLRDVPVGPSRHLVRFVEIDANIVALKELPTRIARKEYAVLRELENRGLPAVHAVGLVEQPDDGNAILVTDYLKRSWQYRRLFMRLPQGLPKHRERLLDAMASLLVELHRHGVFWGDCSLGNTLFKRDGQVLQAYLVDAETSEVYPSLSDGQRQFDLDILVENIAGGLADVAARLGNSVDAEEHYLAASSVADRYAKLWAELHREERLNFDERFRVEAHIRRLNDLGFAVDEIRLEPAEDQAALEVKVAVAGRRFHAEQLRDLTGLLVGEGQATVLLNDLRAYQYRLEEKSVGSAPDSDVGARWLAEVYRPGIEKVRAVVEPGTDLVQAFCDFLEVRWLLSEQARRDVGDVAALQALAKRTSPPESAAKMAILDATTLTFPAIGGEDEDDV